MSALSFKINAETDKLKSFISMLEQLRRVLADIPDSTKDFDVINRKIGEMEARVEQSMRKIAQMERQAMDAAAKTAASATIGNTGGDSTAGAQAAKAETAAYHELIEELKAVNASKKENVILISQYEAQIKRLKSEIDSLNKAESQGMKLTQNQKSSRLEATLSIEEYKQAISRARKELVNQIKFEQVARGSIDEMSQALSRMRTVYRSLNESERTSGWGQNLLKNIESIDTKVKELDATMGVHTRNVGNYASGFNMLGFQIQQVARELPSLAYGPQIFFSAISNNLPMLADEISHAKKSVDELKKAGQTFTPVWKQIASSIFSWQTLLVAGVTVLTLYGKEITSWVASLFKGKTAIDAAAAALEQFNSAMAQGSVSAQSELTKLNLLYNAATDLSKPYEERAEAVKKLQDIYPAYFGNMAAEQVMVGNAVGAYEDLRDAIIEVAQAQAAKDIITENATKRLKITTSNEYKRIQLYANRIDELQSKINDLQNKGISKESPIIRGLIGSIAGLEKGIERASKAIRTKLELPDDIPNDIREYLALLDEADKELAPTAEKLYTTKTPAELNAEAKKARDEAKSAAEKAASDQERNYKDLTKKLQKLQDDSEQAEIDSMEEGTAKKLAQINLDYKKRARAIRDAEKELFELQRKEIDAQYKNDTSSERFLAGQQMVAQYKGNVKHLARPLVKAAELVKKGWEDAGEGIATVFSSQFGILDAKGKVTEILVTPILPNGDILSPQELDDYIYTQLEGAQDILAADTKGLVIATNVAADGSAGEKYHKLQEVYYADNIKAAEGVRIYATAVREANQALKDEEWMNAFLSEAGIKNTEKYLNEQLDAWNEYYMKYGTILEKIQATKDYYDREIEKATTLGDKEKLKKEREAAIAQIKTKESQDWIAFFSWIETMSKNMASNIYNTLRKQLNQMLQTGKISIENYIQATQKLDQQYREKLNERSRLQTLQDSGINGLIDKYQKLGDAMQLKGAKTGDQNIQAMGASMSKAAGNASGVVSMIDMIVTSIHQTIQAIQLLTDSIVEMMASFGQDAEIDTALGKWAELSNMLSEFDNHVYASWEKFKSGDMMGAAAEATSSVFGVITSINKWIDKSKERKIQKIQDQVDALQDSYDKLSRSISKAYSTDAKELIEDQNKLLEQQKILIQRQIEEEKSKKDPDKKRIKEWQKQIDEITNTIEDNAAKAQDAIFGADIQSAINDFAEAYAEAWTKGENRAKSSKDFVKNIIKQMVIEAMKADIKTPLQTIRDKLEEFWKDGIIDQTEENVINEMIDKLNQDLEASFSWADKYFEDGKTKQEATSRGFQAMSQDTGDELNGRFTDIQGKVTDIRGYVMMQTQSIIGLLNSIGNIETAIYTSVQVDNELLRYAVMTYMEIVEINGNTAVMKAALTEIREDIAAIKRNTSEL
jgi:DNA repair exonuclease SbcCD ATPase subunit